MSSAPHDSTEPSPPASATPRPPWQRTGLVAAVALGGVAAVTAIALGADAYWGGEAENPVAASTPDPSPALTQEPPSSPEPVDPTAPAGPTVDYTTEPTQVWQVSAPDLMSGDPMTLVALAAGDPLDRPNSQDTVVVTVEAGSAAAVVGLDRDSGAVSWRTDLAGSVSVDCHVVGTGASTVCVTGTDLLDSETWDVATFETSTGTVQGRDSVTFKPVTVTEINGDLVLAGSALLTGALHMTRGTPDDLDARWQTSSENGYVPATEYYGGFLVDEGTAWSYVSGATMIVDLATGQGESLSAASKQTSAPWPGGTLLESVTEVDENAPEPTAEVDETVTVTVTPSGAAPFTAAGNAWARLGSSDVMEAFAGVGDAAYDSRTGVELWSATPDPEALWTSYTAVDDLVLHQTWWEESVTIAAVDALTGEPRWTSGTRSALLLSRTGDALLADTSFGIEALHLGTGETVWSLDYTDLMTQESYTYAAAHSVAGESLVTTFDQLVTGYAFD
ncbi:hypothetical protein [Sanguibacter suarezii]|uniref:hypothetical protein n=1 Tax=Sanguibacter suarezii TaxID=60921 RepID=UPI0008307D55|nr:hypothetical protein [Sanguibacter suarezii]